MSSRERGPGMGVRNWMVAMLALNFRLQVKTSGLAFWLVNVNSVLSSLISVLGCHFSVLVLADGSFFQIDMHLFGLKIFFDAPGAQFAPEAGLFVSAPGRFHVRRLHVIHP